MDDVFAPLIDATWRGVFSGQRTLRDDPQLQLACSDDFDEGEDGMLLQPVVGPARALLRPALAARLHVHAQPHWTLAQLQQRLQQLGQRTHGADRVFYFPAAELAALAARP
ncbi:TPA: GNAT family N-acetyltransferase, partial [Stenotrophomonas maltophilia]|nr:GNAT family N-acetyltransferase [Stenotrophomonas maltophilia]